MELPEPLRSNEAELKRATASAPKTKGQPALTINAVVSRQAGALGLKPAQYELARKYVTIACKLGSHPCLSELRKAFLLDEAGLKRREAERAQRQRSAMMMQTTDGMRQCQRARESAEESFEAATDEQLGRIVAGDVKVFAEFAIEDDRGVRLAIY